MDETEYRAKQKELLSKIPEELHKPIASMAWEAGHAYGYHEVISHLESYIYYLEKPLKEYSQRLLLNNK